MTFCHGSSFFLKKGRNRLKYYENQLLRYIEKWWFLKSFWEFTFKHCKLPHYANIAKEWRNNIHYYNNQRPYNTNIVQNEEKIWHLIWPQADSIYVSGMSSLIICWKTFGNVHVIWRVSDLRSHMKKSHIKQNPKLGHSFVFFFQG